MLRAAGLVKSYRAPSGMPIRVLAGVDLTVKGGELVVVTGPSGSGKSTLLNVLGLLEDGDGGELWFEDTRVSALGRAASSTFSSAVSDGSSKNDWNRKPTYRPRAWLLATRPRALTLLSSNHSSPPSPSSRSPRTFSSVLFPEPDGPVTTTSSPPFTVRSTPASTRIGIPDGARYDFTRLAARSISYPGGSPRRARPTRPVR